MTDATADYTLIDEDLVLTQDMIDVLIDALREAISDAEHQRDLVGPAGYLADAAARKPGDKLGDLIDVVDYYGLVLADAD